MPLLYFFNNVENRDSSVGIATGCTTGVRFSATAHALLPNGTASMSALWATQPPVQWVSIAGVKAWRYELNASGRHVYCS
jgi:hypothetical protein